MRPDYPKDLHLGGTGFSQTLDSDIGLISITQGDFKASLWFAGETLVFESESAAPKALEIAFGTRRDKTREGIRNDMMGAKTTFCGDQVKFFPSGFLAFHRNADYAMDLAGKAGGQGIPPESLPDVTARRVSGSAIAVEGGFTGQPTEFHVRWQFWDGRAWTGTTPARKQQLITVRLAAAVEADPEKWLSGAGAMLVPKKRAAAKAEELKRWQEFWSRSHIVINSGKGESDAGFLIGRNYQLFRYLLACNRDGEFPLLFNGGIFTTDNNGCIKGNNNDDTTMTNCPPLKANRSRLTSAAGWAAISCPKTNAGSDGPPWPVGILNCSLPARASIATAPQWPPHAQGARAPKVWFTPNR